MFPSLTWSTPAENLGLVYSQVSVNKVILALPQITTELFHTLILKIKTQGQVSFSVAESKILDFESEGLLFCLYFYISPKGLFYLEETGISNRYAGFI